MYHAWSSCTIPSVTLGGCNCWWMTLKRFLPKSSTLEASKQQTCHGFKNMIMESLFDFFVMNTIISTKNHGCFYQNEKNHAHYSQKSLVRVDVSNLFQEVFRFQPLVSFRGALKKKHADENTHHKIQTKIGTLSNSRDFNSHLAVRRDLEVFRKTFFAFFCYISKLDLWLVCVRLTCQRTEISVAPVGKEKSIYKYVYKVYRV